MLLGKIDKHTYNPNMTDAIAVNKELENNPKDNALQKLFTQLCPNNTSLEDILIKCTTLNKLYSTNIFNVLPMAEHILSLNIDERLKQGDFPLVESIVNISEKRRFYSFTTKYCVLHRPQIFCIYDSHVHKVLIYFLHGKYTDLSLKTYETYCQSLREFQTEYYLQELDVWLLDKYLWKLGIVHINKF